LPKRSPATAPDRQWRWKTVARLSRGTSGAESTVLLMAQLTGIEGEAQEGVRHARWPPL
jgi:hypothetical protein